MNVFAPRLFWTGGGGGGVWLLLPLLLSVTITVDVVEALENCNSCEPSYCTDVSVMIWGIYYPKYSCSLCKVTFYTIWGECIPCTNNCISCDATECLYCYPGYYISGGACLLCNSCVAGQAQTRPCLNGLNTICATCASNQIAVNLGGGEQECRDCPAGTYPRQALLCDVHAMHEPAVRTGAERLHVHAEPGVHELSGQQGDEKHKQWAV